MTTIKSSILLICGLPASGKSRLSTALKAKLMNQKIDDGLATAIYVICYDQIVSIINQSAATGQSGAYHRFRRDVWLAGRVFISRILGRQSPDCWSLDGNARSIHSLLIEQNQVQRDNHFIVVVDDNFYYQSMRYQWEKMARQFNMGFGQIFIDCQLETALKRNRQRDDRQQIVPDDVIVKMNERFEASDLFACPDKTLIVPVNCDITSDVMDFIIKIMNDPINAADNNNDVGNHKIIASTNLVHQTDCVLRDVMGMIIKKDGIKTSKNAKLLSAVKQSILKQLRHDTDLLPEDVRDELMASRVSPRTLEFLKQLMEQTALNLKLV